MTDTEQIIDNLGLKPHPEGGYYRETWRSERVLELDDYDGPRNAGTAILFLLPAGEQSRRHRVRSDELWFWQGGDPLELTVAGHPIVLGPRELQAVVPGGEWQSARPLEGEDAEIIGMVSGVVAVDIEREELAEIPIPERFRRRRARHANGHLVTPARSKR